MDWKKWLSYDPYKKIWCFFGRPFTYILRDLWHKAEFVWITGLIALGVCIGHHYDWIIVLKIMGVFTLGYVAGHLFWGKNYVENQQGD